MPYLNIQQCQLAFLDQKLNRYCNLVANKRPKLVNKSQVMPLEKNLIRRANTVNNNT